VRVCGKYLRGLLFSLLAHCSISKLMEYDKAAQKLKPTENSISATVCVFDRLVFALKCLIFHKNTFFLNIKKSGELNFKLKIVYFLVISYKLIRKAHDFRLKKF